MRIPPETYLAVKAAEIIRGQPVYIVPVRGLQDTGDAGRKIVASCRGFDVDAAGREDGVAAESGRFGQ